MQSLFMLLFKSLNSYNVRIHVSNHQNMWLFVRGRVQFVKILKHLLKKEILHSLSVYQQNANWNQNWLLKLSSISALFFLVEKSVIKRINNNIDSNAFWIGSEICKTTRFYCLSILHSSQHPSVWVRLCTMRLCTGYAQCYTNKLIVWFWPMANPVIHCNATLK